MIHRDPSPSLPLFDAPQQRDRDAMFDAANVGIYDLFRTLARKVKANGWDRFSADELLLRSDDPTSIVADQVRDIEADDEASA